jgi:hypothetical protein
VGRAPAWRLDFRPSSRETTALGTLRGSGARGVSEGSGQALRWGCATRVVVDEPLGRRLLIDDNEPIRATNHVFEFFVLVARDKGKAIVLAPNLLVLSNLDLDPLRAGNVFFVASSSALAKKLKTFRLVSWPRFVDPPAEPFDPFVYLPDQRFVPRLSLETGIHGDHSYAARDGGARASAIRSLKWRPQAPRLDYPRDHLIEHAKY